MTTIVLADDHHIVRQGLRALLAAESDFSVVGETGDGVEATLLAERLQPDVLVVDMIMPGLNGIEVTRQVRRCAPHTRVVMLSMYDNEAYVLEALRAGALAYVLKASTAQELVRAIRIAAVGRRCLSPPLSDRAITAYIEKATERPADPLEPLTPREREVLLLVAQGYTTARIAEQLIISRRTVETHRANLMRKLRLESKTDVIRFALQHGLLPHED
jgi:two-component system response regulator NreC